MKLRVNVEEHTFDINIGEDGLNDFAWLALAASKLYGKEKYPKGNYLPIMLKCYDTIPHPRTKLINFINDNGIELFQPAEGEDINATYTFQVEIYKKNHIQTKEHQEWFERAFGSQRNMMKISYEYNYFDVQKVTQPPFSLYLNFQYQIYKELKSEFKNMNIQAEYDLPLEFIQTEEGGFKFFTEIYLPYGDIIPSPPQVFKVMSVDTEKKRQPFNVNPQDFIFQLEPKPMSVDEIQKRIKNRMTIPPHLSEKLLQQEQEIKKEINTGSFCPLDIDQIWLMMENSDGSKQMFEDIEPGIKNKMKKNLADNLNKLYEIFFEYSMLYIQNTDKKEEIKISFQDIMHFLKFYQLFSDSLNLFHFLEFYDNQNIRCESAQSTIDNSYGIDFPEFIEILIRAINFMQAESLMENEESLDMSLERIINQIVTIDSSENDLNEFHKHMKYNITLMTFIRDNSEILQSIFLAKLEESAIENKKFHLQQGQIKSIIMEAGFKGENLDNIVKTCLEQLINEEKFSEGFEGIFYYDFLQVMQWLSLVLITDQEEEEKQGQEEEDPEQGVEQLIEKFKFFISQF